MRDKYPPTDTDNKQRWKLIIEYDGSAFKGWQRQENVMSVQQALEQAVEEFCQQKVECFASGRTDSGVHAMGQVVHFDVNIDPRHTAFVVRKALNALVRPHPIAVVEVEKVGFDFHARFDAKERFYRYLMLERRMFSPHWQGRVWHVDLPDHIDSLDVDNMRAGAKHLIGHQDFTSFRASACQATGPMRTINDIYFTVRDMSDQMFTPARLITMHVSAKSFLHHQVRNIVGTLKEVGQGVYAPDDIKVMLEAKSRCAAGITAPPEGLYFEKTRY